MKLRAVISNVGFGAAVVFGLLLSPVHMAGQATPTLDRMIAPGDWVQVTSPGTLIDAGEVRRVTTDSLYVVDGGQEWYLSADRIQELRVRERRTARYAVGGFLAGSLMGLAAEVFLNPVLCDGDGCNINFLKGALVSGVVVGAGVGLMGYHEFQWRSLLP